MKILLKLLFCSMLILFIGNKAYAQTTKTTEQKSSSEKQGSPQTIPQIKEKGQVGSVIEEMEYYAPIRYVIVYNEIYEKLNDRRMDVLLDEKSFNKENLTAVFTQIAKRFPAPLKLTITIHTSLATIETPEEKQMSRDGQDSRFREKKYDYKDAYFIRDEDKSAVFFYDTSLHPETDEKIVLVGRPVK